MHNGHTWQWSAARMFMCRGEILHFNTSKSYAARSMPVELCRSEGTRQARKTSRDL